MVSDVFGPHTAVGTRTLLICGAIAGPLFTVAWLVEGATRADYSPLRHPVSSLALGEFGWTQVANFIVTGLLTLAFAVGLGGRCGHSAARRGDRCWSRHTRSVSLARGSSSPTP
jgi:hypothetical protein